MRNLGGHLKALREARGWSQTRLASEADVSYHAVYAYERGNRVPQVLQLYKLAKALGTTVDEILKATVPAAA